MATGAGGSALGERGTALVPALLIGIVAFLVLRGPATLDPLNIAWLDQHDRAMHALGVWFYWRAPWGMPPGASPLNGLEYANGVGLSDSLPLVAIPFKLLAPWLPDTFQFWGWWHLLSFVLQALFAALVAARLGLDRPMQLVAALFCVFQPVFLARLDVHMALSSHWTILAAIWLYLLPRPPLWAWPLLLAATAAIHGYLLVMAFAIWLASLVARTWSRQERWIAVGIEATMSVAAIVAVFWAAGILMVGSVESFGYGAFRMNLLGPFNPDGWSLLVPGVATSFAEWEGFNYPGLGMAILAVAAMVFGWRILWRGAAGRAMLPLTLVACGLAVFALGNRVALGSIELFAVPLPEGLERALSTFRSSGRFFWPLGYLVVFGSLVTLARVVPRPFTLVVPLLALLVQVVDTQRGWRGLMVGPERTGTSWQTPLASPAWAALAPHYSRLRALPVTNGGEGWRDLALLAFTHRLATDAANLGRVDPARMADAISRGEQSLADGSFDAGAIYVLDAALLPAVATHLNPGDLLATIDGQLVFARGGAEILDRAGIAYRPVAPAPASSSASP